MQRNVHNKICHHIVLCTIWNNVLILKREPDPIHPLILTGENTKINEKEGKKHWILLCYEIVLYLKINFLKFSFKMLSSAPFLFCLNPKIDTNSKLVNFLSKLSLAQGQNNGALQENHIY